MKKLRQWLCAHDFYTTNKEFALFHCRKCDKLAADYFDETIDTHIKSLFFILKVTFWSTVLCGTIYYSFWLIGGM